MCTVPFELLEWSVSGSEQLRSADVLAVTLCHVDLAGSATAV